MNTAPENTVQTPAAGLAPASWSFSGLAPEDDLSAGFLARREAESTLSGPLARALAQHATEGEGDPAWIGRQAQEQKAADKARREGQYALDALAGGATPASIEAELGGLQDPSPLLDPVNLIADLSTGFATAPGRAGVKALLRGEVRQGAAVLGRNVAQDVGYGLAASGSMSAAEAAGAGPLVQTLAGVVGPVAAPALFQLGRRGLAEFLKRAAQANPEVYKGVVATAEAHPEMRFSRDVAEVAGELRGPGQAEVRPDAPGAAVEAGIPAAPAAEGAGPLAKAAPGAPAVGLAKADVEAAVAPLQGAARNALPLEVVESLDELPEHVRAAIPEGSGRVDAVYDPDSGKVLLVAGNIPTPERAVAVWMHEQGVHVGLRGLMGAERMAGFLDHVFDHYGAEALEPVRKAYSLDLGNVEHRRIAAEEQLARLAERIKAGDDLSADERGLWRRLVDQVRGWLRERGVDVDLSETEIARTVRDSVKWTMEGGQPVRSREGLRFSAEPGGAASAAASAQAAAEGAAAPASPLREFAARSGISLEPGAPLVEIAAKAPQAAQNVLARGVTWPSGDKAVNINFAHVDSPEAAKGLVERVAAEFRPQIDEARRGVVHEEALKGLANDLGMSEETLLRRGVGQAYNAEELLAARWTVWKSAEDLMALAREVRAGNNSDELLAAFRRRVDVHAGLQAQLSGATAEAGRALRQMQVLASTGDMRLREVSDLIQNAGGRGRVEDMAAMLANLAEGAEGGLADPAAVNAFLKQASRATGPDMLLEAWINALLSGPQTHATNTISNALVSLWQVPERLLAAGFGRVLPGEQAIHAGEALAQGYGLLEGFRDGLRIAARGGLDLARLRPVQGADALGKIEGRRAAITAENLRQTFAGRLLGKVPGVNLEAGGFAARAVDLLGEAVRTPGKALGVEDDFFKAIGFRMELRAQAYRVAAGEGLTGADFARRVQEVLADPPEHVRLAAQDAARYQTFTQELGKFGQAVQGVASSHPLARLVVPFVRTPVNVMKFALERTPAAPLMRSFRADVAAGGARRDLALARASLGSLVMALTASMAASGHVTGGGPSEPKARALLRETGWQPYSLRIGDAYYAYGRLEPLGSVLGLAADAAEIMGRTDDEAERERLAATVTMALAKNLTSKTFLRGVSEVVQAMSDPDRYGERYWQKLAGSLVPAAAAQFNRSFMDNTLRDTRGWLDEIKGRTPGLSKDLPPRRNLWGEPIALEGSLGPDILSPVYVSGKKESPASEELLRLGLYLDKPQRVQSLRGVAVELSPQEYDRLQELAGNEAKDPGTGLGFKETVEALAGGFHANAGTYGRLSEGAGGGRKAVSRKDRENARQAVQDSARAYAGLGDGPEGGKALMLRQYRQMFLELAREELLREFPELGELVHEQRSAAGFR